MSLDLTTLKAGDTIRSTHGAQDWSAGKLAEVRYVGRQRVVADLGDTEVFIDPTRWDLVPPVPACPITEPVTMHYNATGSYSWTPNGRAGACDGITLHPPGAFPNGMLPDGVAHWGYWTVTQ